MAPHNSGNGPLLNTMSVSECERGVATVVSRVTQPLESDLCQSQHNREIRKENETPELKVPSAKKTLPQARAHPYRSPIRRERKPEMTPAGILDYGTLDFAHCYSRSALLQVMGLKKFLDQGQFGQSNSVLCGRPQNAKQKFVAKFYPDSSVGFFKELKVARDLSHPNIFNSISFRKVNNVYIKVSSHISNGSLASHIGYLGPITTIEFFIKITRAVSFLHSRHVYHRNLTPDSVLIDDDFNPKICGFDKADVPQPVDALTNTEDVTQCIRHYGTLVDSRALGEILFCLVFQVNHQKRLDFYGLAKRARFPRDASRPVYFLMQQCIIKLVTPVSTTRWTPGRVLTLLGQHQELLLKFCGVSVGSFTIQGTT